MKDSLIVQTEGNPEVSRKTCLYNPDMVIGVGIDNIFKAVEID